MSHFKPHVYFASVDDQYFLSILASVPVNQTLRIGTLNLEGEELIVPLRVVGKSTSESVQLTRKAYDLSNFNGKAKSIKVVVTGSGANYSIGLDWNRDCDLYTETPNNWHSARPHLYVESAGGNKIAATAYLKESVSEANSLLVFEFDGKATGEIPASGTIDGYKVYATDSDHPANGKKYSVSAEFDDNHAKAKPKKKRKKAKVRHV